MIVYHTLYEISIPTWAVMEERFLQGQLIRCHNLKFVKHVATSEIGMIDNIPWDLGLEDQKDSNLGAITGHEEEGEVSLINVI